MFNFYRMQLNDQSYYMSLKTRLHMLRFPMMRRINTMIIAVV